MTLPRPAWVKLNKIRIGMGFPCATTHKRKMVSTPTSKFGARELPANGSIVSCSTRHPPYRALEYNWMFKLWHGSQKNATAAYEDTYLIFHMIQLHNIHDKVKFFSLWIQILKFDFEQNPGEWDSKTRFPQKT